MVKGISRQVILVEAPEPKLFEQAIFILRHDMGEGITDAALLKEAEQVLRSGGREPSARPRALWSAAGAAGGAAAVGLVWLLTALL